MLPNYLKGGLPQPFRLLPVFPQTPWKEQEAENRQGVAGALQAGGK